MIYFLKLIRYQNLMLIALMQYLFKWMLIDVFFKESALLSWQYTLMVIATLCIAAAGNIINDLQDVDADRINKPKKVIIGTRISEKIGNWLYIGFTFAGVLLGFYVANASGRPGFAVIFVLISGLLYYYSVSLKKVPVVGNLLVSLLVSFAVLLTGVFTILPIASDTNRYLIQYIFKILLWYACFAFYINFLRELIKDVEDIDGDHSAGVVSIPMVIGRKRTVRLLSMLTALPCAALLFAVYEYLHTQPFLNVYILFGIMGPLLYVAFTSWDAKKRRQYRRISILLKIIMLLGVFSIIVIRFTLFNKL
ncbi:geranylgeranylglycerol-phosphate geranylgeranyltransferase [Flavobacteriaceae bacterium M23B6Z8]